jgi:hypothetical protein
MTRKTAIVDKRGKVMAEYSRRYKALRVVKKAKEFNDENEKKYFAVPVKSTRFFHPGE